MSERLSAGDVDAARLEIGAVIVELYEMCLPLFHNSRFSVFSLNKLSDYFKMQS